LRLVLLATLALVAGAARAAPAQEPPPRDIADDRGFLIAKATTLPRGSGYVTALMPGALGVAYGLSDRLTGQLGTVPWTLFNGLVLGFASLRYRLLRSSFAHISVGGFGITGFDQHEYEAAGWPYVATTVGTARYSVSALVGVGSSTSIFESDFDGQMLVQFEGEARVDRTLKVIAETLYLGEGSETLGAVGVRFLGDRVAGDVGVGFVLSGGSGFFPWVALAYSL
jgi:hypothetical protein